MEKKLLDELEKMKAHFEKKTVQCRRMFKSALLADKAKSEGSIQIKSAKENAERMQQITSVKIEHVENELERWSDTRAGTEDEVTVDNQTLQKMDKENSENLKQYTKKISTCSKLVKEMYFFYDENQCSEKQPDLGGRIDVKQKDHEGAAAQNENWQRKLEQVALKKEMRRVKDVMYPGEPWKRINLKAMRKQRSALVQHMMANRLKLSEILTEEDVSSMTLSQDSTVVTQA